MAAGRYAHRLRDRIVQLAASREIEPITRPARDILIIRPDHLGDLLMLQPAVTWLRPVVSDARLVLMAGPWAAGAARHAIPVDEVVECPFPGFDRGRARSPLTPYRLVRDTAEQVRLRRPRAAVILRDDHWWGAWMAREAGISTRLGHDHPALTPHLTHPVRVGARHWVERNAEALAASLRALGYTVPPLSDPPRQLAMRWPIDPSGAVEAQRLLASSGVEGSYAVIHPGSGAPVKLWPARRWAAVAGALSSENGLKVVVTGGPGERDLTATVVEGISPPALDLGGRTSIGTLGETFRGAAIVLGVDSGPLHLAVATGTPTVHLYGPSDVAAYGPWGDRARHAVVSSDLSCPRCGDLSPARPEGCACMLGISLDATLAAARRVLGDA